MNPFNRLFCFLVAAIVAMVLCSASRLLAGQWILDPETGKETPVADASPERQELDRAKALLVQNKPKDARKMLGKWIKKYPGSPLRSEADYYTARCLERQGELYDAFKQYEKLIEDYTDLQYFHKALEAEFAIAKRFLNGTKRRALGIFWVSAADVGIKILQDIPDRWPGSSLAEQSLMSLGDYYLARGEQIDAISHYDQLIIIYPSSTLVRSARFLAASAYLDIFKGPKFDPAPLVEARERLFEYRRLYGNEANAAEIQAMLERIDSYEAEHEYEIARFYQRTGKKKAARFHYRQLLQHWPESKWASAAQQKLNNLGG